MIDSKLKSACESARVRYSEQVPNSSEPFKSVDVIFCEELSPLFAEMEKELSALQTQRAFAVERADRAEKENIAWCDALGEYTDYEGEDSLIDELHRVIQSERTAREAAELLAEVTAKGSFDASEVMARENASLRAELERVQKVARELENLVCDFDTLANRYGRIEIRKFWHAPEANRWLVVVNSDCGPKEFLGPTLESVIQATKNQMLQSAKEAGI